MYSFYTHNNIIIYTSDKRSWFGVSSSSYAGNGIMKRSVRVGLTLRSLHGLFIILISVATYLVYWLKMCGSC